VFASKALDSLDSQELEIYGDESVAGVGMKNSERSTIAFNSKNDVS